MGWLRLRRVLSWWCLVTGARKLSTVMLDVFRLIVVIIIYRQLGSVVAKRGFVGGELRRGRRRSLRVDWRGCVRRMLLLLLLWRIGLVV